MRLQPWWASWSAVGARRARLSEQVVPGAGARQRGHGVSSTQSGCVDNRPRSPLAERRDRARPLPSRPRGRSSSNCSPCVGGIGAPGRDAAPGGATADGQHLLATGPGRAPSRSWRVRYPPGETPAALGTAQHGPFRHNTSRRVRPSRQSSSTPGRPPASSSDSAGCHSRFQARAAQHGRRSPACRRTAATCCSRHSRRIGATTHSKAWVRRCFGGLKTPVHRQATHRVEGRSQQASRVPIVRGRRSLTGDCLRGEIIPTSVGPARGSPAPGPGHRAVRLCSSSPRAISPGHAAARASVRANRGPTGLAVFGGGARSKFHRSHSRDASRIRRPHSTRGVAPAIQGPVSAQPQPGGVLAKIIIGPQRAWPGQSLHGLGIASGQRLQKAQLSTRTRVLACSSGCTGAAGADARGTRLGELCAPGPLAQHPASSSGLAQQRGFQPARQGTHLLGGSGRVLRHSGTQRHRTAFAARDRSGGCCGISVQASPGPRCANDRGR